MDRLNQAFARTKAESRAAFIAYLCAGDPDFATSLRLCRVLLEGGVDILELGVPFSDPLADGLTNQLAAQRALASGMTQDRVFELVRTLRNEFSEVPLVLYTYYNLIHSRGVDNYASEAKKAGVDGLLTLDLPPEEASELRETCKKQGLANIFILAPTTPPDRIQRITEAGTGFFYYVSRTGVTGVREALAEDLSEKVRAIKAATDLPVVVGFGISKAEHIHAVGEIADGAVVGSALVNCIPENAGQPDRMVEALRDKLAQLTGRTG